MDQETNVQFKADGEEIGDLTQSLVRLSRFMPVCRDHLSQRFRNTELRGGNHVWKGLSWRVSEMESLAAEAIRGWLRASKR